MTTNPAHLRQLAAYWASRGGVNLGVVGSMRSHCQGYHLGRDRIFGPVACRRGGVPRPGLGNADYSVQTARDRAGLTNAASAIDLGRLGGSLPELYRFSRWLVERCRANAPGTDAIREVIYSPDGRTVLRWDRERGHTSAPRAGEGDASHLTHPHISFYRDVRADLRPLFAAYPHWPEVATPAPKPPAKPRPKPKPVEIDMPDIIEAHVGQRAVIKVGANVRAAPTLTGTVLRTIAGSPEAWIVVGWVRGDATDGSDRWLTRLHGRRWEFTHSINVSEGPLLAPDASLARARALEGRLAVIKRKVAAFAADIADD